MTSFEQFHPIALFIYYITAIGIAMFTMYPLIIAAVILGGILYYSVISTPKDTINNIIFYFFLFLIISITNPIFTHNGKTILFFMNDKPMTLEAVLYGMAASSMLIGIIFWCQCYSRVMTSDKFVYLFGRIIPKMSLILSMAFRFVPVFKDKAKKIQSAQKSMGLYATDSIADKFLGGIRIFSALLTWSIENSVDTADTMKARGYGLKGRTNYSEYYFQKQDAALIFLCLLEITVLVIFYTIGSLYFYYYPEVKYIIFDYYTIVPCLMTLFFMIIPFIVEVRGKIVWKLLELKI